MAQDNVSIFRPKPRAKLAKSTGSVDLEVPVDFNGERHTIRMGVVLLGAPVDALTDDPEGRKKLEEALFDALTGEVQVRWNEGKQVKNMPLYKAVADTVEFKMKDTL